MAEGLFKKYLKESGKANIRVSSAGIMALDGFSPTAETILVADEGGVDVSSIRSRRITKDMIRRSDLILVMEAMHRDFIVGMDPEAAAKTHFLRLFKAESDRKYPEGQGIPDPIGKPLDFYKLSFQIIKEETKRIAGLL